MQVGFVVLICLFLFFFGAAVYSFLNVVIFRVPRGEEFVKTRSHCPGCGRILTPLELVPVVSYVCLGGKCKNCGSKIGLRDVSIEIFGGMSAILSVLYFVMPFMGNLPERSMLQKWIGNDVVSFLYGAILAGAAAFALIGILTVICFIHIDTGKVKAGTLIALTVIGILGVFALPEVALSERLIGGLMGFVPFLVLGLFVKNQNLCASAVLCAVVGGVLGLRGMAAAAVLIVLMGAFWAIILLVTGTKRLENRFQIVPIICMASAVSLFCGNLIADMFFPGL